MNWNTIVTGLVELAAFAGPVLLIHHTRIKAIIKAIGDVADAATQDDVNTRD